MLNFVVETGTVFDQDCVASFMHNQISPRFLSVASALKVPPGSSQSNVHVAQLACSGQNQPKFLQVEKGNGSIAATSQ